jgi:AcrR family transcriptional regulator
VTRGVGAKATLTRRDWAAAALEAIADGGIASIAVETLALRVGASKGSFYWHYANRAEVIEAALALWEEEGTEAGVREREAEIADPRRRLEDLLTAAFRNPAAGRIEAALAAGVRHPAVAPVVARVTRRRLESTAAIFRDLGFDAETAGRRALVAYSTYLGTFALSRACADEPPTGAELDAYLAEVVRLLVVGAPGRISGS